VEVTLRALVTGGAGFIGSNIVERLLNDGHDVRVIDNFSTGHRHNLEPFLGHIEVIEGDLQSYERAHKAVQGMEIVFHEAALPSVPRSVQDPLTTSAVNITGTLNTLLSARDSGVRRFVYASSSSAYGNNPVNPRVEDATPSPLAPYAVSKLAGEHYCRAFANVYGMETVSLRYFNVFGPRQDPDSQYSAVIPRFIRALIAGDEIGVFGDGEQTRDFTFVDNVVEANLLAASASIPNGEVFNIACGEAVTVNMLVSELAGILGTTARTTGLPARPGDVRDSEADIGRAREVLGFEPSVRLHEGLEKTVEWFRSRK
jgi:nucleoside-diphosphate-sugar epimerase